jgi:hypothetical protein
MKVRFLFRVCAIATADSRHVQVLFGCVLKMVESQTIGQHQQAASLSGVIIIVGWLGAGDEPWCTLRVQMRKSMLRAAATSMTWQAAS